MISRKRLRAIHCHFGIRNVQKKGVIFQTFEPIDIRCLTTYFKINVFGMFINMQRMVLTLWRQCFPRAILSGGLHGYNWLDHVGRDFLLLSTCGDPRYSAVSPEQVLLNEGFPSKAFQKQEQTKNTTQIPS